jgi:Homeodomain-like domain
MLVYNAKSSSVYGDPSGDPFDQALTDPLVVSRRQRHRGLGYPHWKIPPSEWPTVLRRVEQGEPLRKIARAYHVSYETIRRVLRAARLQQAG